MEGMHLSKIALLLNLVGFTSDYLTGNGKLFRKDENKESADKGHLIKIPKKFISEQYTSLSGPQKSSKLRFGLVPEGPKFRKWGINNRSVEIRLCFDLKRIREGGHVKKQASLYW